MSRAIRSLCKTLDLIAANNETAAVAVMRAAEASNDQVLKQQLLNVIHRLNVDATLLQAARHEIAHEGLKRA
ncbi:hypothetical protein ACVW0Y_001108 [Pseudomonas sp. TE3786]